MSDLLPFWQLNEDEFKNLVKHSNLNLSNNEINKLRNLIFNPFSINSRGKTFLTLKNELNSDYNYYNVLANYVDECDYDHEDSFNQLAKVSNNIQDFSLLHLNIRSMVNKYDDFQAYLESLKYSFPLIGITETWFNKENENSYPPCRTRHM